MFNVNVEELVARRNEDKSGFELNMAMEKKEIDACFDNIVPRFVVAATIGLFEEWRLVHRELHVMIPGKKIRFDVVLSAFARAYRNRTRQFVTRNLILEPRATNMKSSSKSFHVIAAKDIETMAGFDYEFGYSFFGPCLQRSKLGLNQGSFWVVGGSLFVLAFAEKLLQKSMKIQMVFWRLTRMWIMIRMDDSYSIYLELAFSKTNGNDCQRKFKFASAFRRKCIWWRSLEKQGA